jgi:hypothetical protein
LGYKDAAQMGKDVLQKALKEHSLHLNDADKGVLAKDVDASESKLWTGEGEEAEGGDEEGGDDE